MFSEGTKLPPIVAPIALIVPNDELVAIMFVPWIDPEANGCCS